MKNNEFSRCDIRLQKDIERLLSRTKTEVMRLNNELKTLRGGTLYTKKYKSNSIFTEYYNGRERSIGKDKSRIHMLARRKYISSQLKCMLSYHKLLQRLVKDMNAINNTNNTGLIIDKYASLGLDMDKILLSRQQQEWLNQPYERNPAFPDELKFTTDNNKLMRTKSELIIANRLEHYNIPYLPEKPLWFDYDFYPKYPDFTILKPDGSTMIWEHMGRMDKEDYFIKNSRKIIEYRRNGYSQNTNLIITFEEDIIEPGLIDHIIECRILL